MTSEPQRAQERVEMPRPTVAPLTSAVGLSLLAAGLPFGLGFVVVGAAVFIAGLCLWIAELLPGHGHEEMPLVDAERRARPVAGAPGGVVQMRPGMPGYRFRIPEAVHPISAGIRGGIVGAVVMPVPALLWGLASGHGIWYPVNLLAGMLLPGVDRMDVAELEQFQGALLVVAILIHLTVSVILGLMYGVILPTLPDLPQAIAWGGLLAPLVWTGLCYAFMGAVGPDLQRGVSWPWFMVTQFLFGIVAAVVISESSESRPIGAGLRGGAAGAALMPIPAFVWSFVNGHTIWYPVNLLAAIILRELGRRPLQDLDQFHAAGLLAGLVVHAILSVSFGILLALLRPKLSRIPAPVAWGGLVMPLLWSGLSYGLMGVVNPVLQERVDWPWFVVSQFVFGVTAAIVVLRSEMVYIAPAGPGVRS